MAHASRRVLIEPRFNTQLCAIAPLLFAAIVLLGRYVDAAAGAAQADQVLYNVLEGGNDGLYDDLPAGGGVAGLDNPLYGAAATETSTDGEDLYGGFGDEGEGGGQSGYMDINATPDDVPSALYDVPSGEYDSVSGSNVTGYMDVKATPDDTEAAGYMDVKATPDDTEAAGYMDVSPKSGVSNPMCVSFSSVLCGVVSSVVVLVWYCFLFMATRLSIVGEQTSCREDSRQIGCTCQSVCNCVVSVVKCY
jgi:hypothetical protein